MGSGDETNHPTGKILIIGNVAMDVTTYKTDASISNLQVMNILLKTVAVKPLWLLQFLHH